MRRTQVGEQGVRRRPGRSSGPDPGSLPWWVAVVGLVGGSLGVVVAVMGLVARLWAPHSAALTYEYMEARSLSSYLEEQAKLESKVTHEGVQKVLTRLKRGLPEQAMKEPGYVVYCQVDLVGYRRRHCWLEWSASGVGRGGPTEAGWESTRVQRVGLAPSYDREPILVPAWVYRPKKHGRYVVRFRLLDDNSMPLVAKDSVSFQA
jgi:hypothetical protein